jgi:antitoxin component YwqK of YwqJK toxin-antitoxin module
MKKIFTVFLFSLFCGLTIAQDINVVIKENENHREELRYNDRNQLDGKCYVWNKDGMIVAVASYKHGDKHGVWKIWYDNGQLAYRIQYKNGKKVGTWKHWDEDGNTVLAKQYEL